MISILCRDSVPGNVRSGISVRTVGRSSAGLAPNALLRPEFLLPALRVCREKSGQLCSASGRSGLGRAPCVYVWLGTRTHGQFRAQELGDARHRSRVVT